jgi:bacterioferritin (cytochrome b1)
MSRLEDSLYKGWRHFLEALEADHRQKLLEVLREEYLEEAQDVAQFTQHVKYMPYPQFRDRLRRIIDEEQAHVQWLHDQILALGGDIPAFSPVPKAGRTSWACLLMDLEEEKRSCEALLEGIHVAEESEQQVAEGLRRIREEEQRHRDQILDLLMKLDPYSLPPGPGSGGPSDEARA